MAAPIMRNDTEALLREENIWPSQMSELNSQPCENVMMGALAAVL